MNRDEARAIEWDCAQILIRFFNELDAWCYGDMVKLFAPDGVWHRQGRALRGAEAILAVLAQRSTTQTVRHVVTNVQVTALDADTAKSLHDTGEQATAPPVIRSPSLLLAVPGELTRTDEGWRISSLTMTRVFEFQP
jgi:hypothetical protein